MAGNAYREVMDDLDTLGDDLVLLSVSPEGKLTTAQQIGFGLMGSELVSHPRHHIGHAYLERLAAAGVLHAERSNRLGIFPVTRWRVADPGRQAEAKARLDAIALSTGPVSTAQAALAGLAHATGLGTVLYPGRPNREIRSRLERIAKGGEVTAAVADAGAGDAASQAVAATNQAVRAAADAATQAAIDAATSAAVHAATQAAHSAAHSAGHGGGGGHGH